VLAGIVIAARWLRHLAGSEGVRLAVRAGGNRAEAEAP
jgi:hypothetical protein